MRSELLEPRHLLALDVAFNDGILEIHSDHHDDIIVTARANSVMINGEHPEGRCIVADQVRQIHADGGLLSHVDLSAVRRNRDAFPQVELMTRSATSEDWLRDVAGVEKVKFDQLFNDLYADPSAASRGVTWSTKLDWIDQTLRNDGVSDMQLDWIREFDFFPADKMAYYDNLAAQRAESDASLESETHALPADMSAAEGEDSCTPIYVNLLANSFQPPYHTSVEEYEGFASLRAEAPGHSCGINPFSVDYDTSEVTALDGEDYTGQSGTLTWADGEEGEVKVVDVPIINDTIDEPLEEFEFRLSNLQNFDGDECDVSMGIDLVTVRILDDDPMPNVSIIGDPSVPEDAGSVTLEVELDHPSGYPITVDWETEADTATADFDYVEDDDSLYFAPGETSKQITVAIIDDEIDEWDETFKVKLTYADYAIEDDWQSIVTIVDEDPLPNLYIESVTVPETIGDAEVRTWIDRETEKQAYAHYDTQEFTALANWDYTPRSGVVSFPEYLEDLIHIPIVNDPYAEWDETFHVVLSQPTNLNIVTSQGNVTIISEDPDPFVNIGNAVVTEGDPGDDTIATFTVSLSAPSGKTIYVTVETSDGSAVEGDDYEPTSETVVFELSLDGPQITNGLSRSVSVPIVEDLIPELTEEYFVTLSNAFNAIPGLMVGTGTINDDDQPDLELTIHQPSVVDPAEPEVADFPGAVTFVNLDNDDQDGSFDNQDTNGVGTKDDELAKLVLTLKPANMTGTASLDATSGGNKIKIWKNPDRTDAFTLGNIPINDPIWTTVGDDQVAELWVEGIDASTAPQDVKLEFKYQQTGFATITDEVGLTIVGVEEVEIKGQNNSINDDDTLDNNDPNWPSGIGDNLRVFPGARLQGGSPGARRDEVTVEVKLTVAPPHDITVHGKVFDVDDPSADSDAVDDESAADDNRKLPTEEVGFVDGIWVSETGEFGFTAGSTTKSRDFRVALNPGDNYRFAVNGDRDFINQLENDDTTASASNADKQRIVDPSITGGLSAQEVQHPDKYASDTVTVWRFMHTELDTMPGPILDDNAIYGAVTDIDGGGGAITRLYVDQTLNDGSADLDDPTPQNGRFENGEIGLGVATQVTTSPLVGNGDDFVEFAASNPFGGLEFSAEDNAIFFSATITGSITSVTKNGANFVWTINPDQPVIIWEDYVGGTMEVGDGEEVDIVAVNAAASTLTTDAMNVAFVLRDDDDELLLPYQPTMLNDQFFNDPYRKAYIEAVPLSGIDNTLAEFSPNTPKEDVYFKQESEHDSKRSDAFWVAYSMWVFQLEATRDYDPDSERSADGSTGNGVTSDLVSSGVHRYSAVAVETGREFFALWNQILPGVPNPYPTFVGMRWRTLAHEIGHQFDLSHPPPPPATPDPGLMGPIQYGWFFRPEDLASIRSEIKSPGRR